MKKDSVVNSLILLVYSVWLLREHGLDWAKVVEARKHNERKTPSKLRIMTPQGEAIAGDFIDCFSRGCNRIACMSTIPANEPMIGGGRQVNARRATDGRTTGPGCLACGGKRGDC